MKNLDIKFNKLKQNTFMHIFKCIDLFLLGLVIIFVIDPCLAQNIDGNTRDYFPSINKWEKISANQSDVNIRKLNNALRYAKQQKSSSIMVVLNGRILAEKYWKVKEPSARYKGFQSGPQGSVPLEDVASIQKSVVSLLCGIALSKGLISLDSPVSCYLGSGWTNSHRELEITIKHLITMSSGLDLNMNFRYPPGTHWNYNTMAYKHLVEVLESVTNNNINEITKSFLCEKIGMQSSRWEIDPERDNPYRFITTPRDLARLGLLILNKGKWENEEIITDKDYISKAFSSEAGVKVTYGYLFWLNANYSFIQSAPEDMITMFGALNRYVYVVPQLSFVVVRLGDKPEDDFNNNFWSLLMESVLN